MFHPLVISIPVIKYSQDFKFAYFMVNIFLYLLKINKSKDKQIFIYIEFLLTDLGNDYCAIEIMKDDEEHKK